MRDLPRADANQLKSSPDVQVVLPDNPIQTPFFELDNTTEPFNNPKARQALSYAVNRPAILDASYFGLGTAAPANSPISVNSPDYNADLVPFDFDLQKAKSLFAEAGVTKLTYWSVAGAFPEFRTTGEIVQSDLASIGIDMKIEEKEVSSWVEPFYPPGKKFPGYVIPNFLSFSQADPLFILNFWTTGLCECNYSNAEFDKLYKQASGEKDATARTEIYKQMQKIMYDDVPSIQLAQSTGPAGVRKEVTGVWVQPGGRIRLEDAALTQ
jgi:peptide/nickel transport system substrate-binding protein